MATMALASPFPRLFQHSHNVALCSLPKDVKLDAAALCINHSSRIKFTCSRSLIYCSSSKAGTRLLLKPISAVGSGLEASITDPKDNAISIKNVEIVVESKGDDKMQVRVDLTGKETEIVFEKTLRNLARTAPPVPGFRKKREDIKENLTVKDNKINTIQTAEELKSAFIPGNDFGFNATLELEQSTEESD
ncbi:hypothetical protein Sango_2398000 [Sesamum angolense]|uniref:Trigger factor ribosome-binding bacterial domain-containing protein n=1 Tax=Sesamum angolense TaxID=2727404 RepID=A0AAE1W792_9LAMI|nr:hypothetical protein Sango_2398000 [Sesamum angolense]